MKKYFGILCVTTVLAAVSCGEDEKIGSAGSAGSAGTGGSGGKGGAAGSSGSSGSAGSDASAGTSGSAGSDGGKDAADDGAAATQIARGNYLVNVIGACGDCHTPPKADRSGPDTSKLLSGTDCFVDTDPANPDAGCLNTANLTNHETGLKTHAPGEIKDMFMKGLRPDGKALHPVMPYWVLGNMKAEDADAIVAYLRTVPGVDHTVKPNQAPFLAPAAPAPLWPDAQIPKPSSSYPNQAEAIKGRYLAGSIGICMECHTAHNDADQPIITKAFQGGRDFALGIPGFPEHIFSANITPHATGIEGYTVSDIVAVLKQGKDKNQGGSPICPPMPAGPMGAFGNLTDEDATNIAHYLLSIPGGNNVVAQDCLPPGFLPDGGMSKPDGGSEGGAPDGGATDSGNAG